MPKKGKDFTPNQKRAITIKYNKIKELLISTVNGEATFIPNKKISGLTSTNKGTFVTANTATTIKAPKKYGNLTLVKIGFGQRRELYIPFPEKIKDNFDAIKNFVEELRKKYKPDYVRWATKGQVKSEVFNPDSYTLYGAEYFSTRSQMHKDAIHTGVYFGWRPSKADFVVSVPERQTAHKTRK
jgi:hypothetical protein